MALVRPPGHHAMEDTLCGFCGFNNVVVAARAALERGVKRILIVDWDLHHGQGTQFAFCSDPRVLYQSVHRYEQGRYWPHLRESNYDVVGEGTGLGYNVNVPLNTVGCGPADYLAVFHSVLLPVATQFQPELVLVSAGYDAALGCPEGEMLLSPGSYSHLVCSLASLAYGRLVLVLEGGYCLPSLAESAALSLRALLGDPCPLLGRPPAPLPATLDSIRGAVTALRPHWPVLSVWRVGEPGHPDTFSPDLSFHPPDGWPPASFPTRDYSPSHDAATRASWERLVCDLVATTELLQPVTKLALLYDPAMERHEAEEEHPECPARTARIWAALESVGLPGRAGVIRLPGGRRLIREESLMVHQADHWDLLAATANLPAEELENLADSFNSIYLNPASVECGLLAAGGVLDCVDHVLVGGGAGLAVVRPPGHHAEPDQPHGFCLFNNVGIAAQYAVSKHGLDRVLVVDWDVHHGNGIQHMFYNDSHVLYISLHRLVGRCFFTHSQSQTWSFPDTTTVASFPRATTRTMTRWGKARAADTTSTSLGTDGAWETRSTASPFSRSSFPLRMNLNHSW